MRLIVKPVACTPENFKTYMGETARNVIQQLLIALTLVQPTDEESTTGEQNTESTGEVTAESSIKQTQTSGIGEGDEQVSFNPLQSCMF